MKAQDAEILWKEREARIVAGQLADELYEVLPHRPDVVNVDNHHVALFMTVDDAETFVYEMRRKRETRL